MRYPSVLLCLTTALALTGCVFVNTPFGRGGNTLHETKVRGQGSAKILWLPISGFISDTPSERAFGLVSRPSTLARVSQALDKAKKDDAIAAVVIRIESPGGTVAAADEIYARIKRYHQTTDVPVIASLGGVAASGGYYVAMAADTVIAQPTTITGSIGVIIFGVNVAGLLDKLGIQNNSFRSRANKDILSPLKTATPAQHKIVQRVVDTLYARFVRVVEQNRPTLDRDHLDTITDGRIFAAADARKLGLVDAVGHLPDVLAAARREADVSHARVIRYYRGFSAPATIVAGAGARAPRAGALDLGLSMSQNAAAQPLYLWRP